MFRTIALALGVGVAVLFIGGTGVVSAAMYADWLADQAYKQGEAPVCECCA